MAGSLVMHAILADPPPVGAMRIDFRSIDPAYRNQLKNCFAANVRDAAFDKIRMGLQCDEPLAVFLTPVAHTKSRFGRLTRHCIRCLDDRAIPLAGQNFMIGAVDAELETTTHVQDLPTSHSPWASQSAALVELLVSIAAQSSSAAHLQRFEG